MGLVYFYAEDLVKTLLVSSSFPFSDKSYKQQQLNRKRIMTFHKLLHLLQWWQTWYKVLASWFNVKSFFSARIPVRLYVRSLNKDFENLEDVPVIDTWDDISYLNRPVEFLREEGKNFILMIHIVVITLFIEKNPKVLCRVNPTVVESLFVWDNWFLPSSNREMLYVTWRH